MPQNKYLKLINKTFSLFVLLCFLSPSIMAQGRIWFAEAGANIYQERKVEFNSGSANKKGALAYFFNINTGGQRVAFGMQANYSKIDLNGAKASGLEENSLKLWDFYALVRYYPLLPTARIGTKVALRFTTGVMAGAADIYWRGNDGYGSILKWSPLQFSSVLFAGIVISPFRNTTGVAVKLNYMPQTLSMKNFPLGDFKLKQPFSLSAALFIGSKIKS
jgi:hypothetical protein